MTPTLSLGLSQAHRVLARAGYGARAGEAEALVAGGVAAWVDRQLALPADEPRVESGVRALRVRIFYAAGPGEQITEGLRGFTSLHASQAERWALIGDQVRRVPPQETDRPRLEVALSALYRRATAEAQLRERMVEFWHDHFSVSSQAGQQVSVSLPDHDQRIRRHALGDFRALLEAVASGPAILMYLNNQSSRAGAPNENFARELLELHTLGRAAYIGATRDWRAVPRDTAGQPQGYADADVWEVARAFTGWSVTNGQGIDAATALPRSGEFRYVESWHDPYQKRVLGHEMEPFAPAMMDGRVVLDLLAAHPATARFVCGKLARFLIGDPPPQAAIDRAVAAFRAHLGSGDQIAATVRALLAGPEVADAAHLRVRRPSDVALAAVRAFAMAFTPQPPLIGEMANAGQLLFGWVTPDGPPLDAAYYLTAGGLRKRWQIGFGLAQNWWQTGRSPLFAELAGQDIRAVTARLAALAMGPDGEAAGATIAAAWAAAGRNPKPNAGNVEELAAWVLATPGFQTC
jgi:uncharacterized protein (DUF1800 family)